MTLFKAGCAGFLITAGMILAAYRLPRMLLNRPRVYFVPIMPVIPDSNKLAQNHVSPFIPRGSASLLNTLQLPVHPLASKRSREDANHDHDNLNINQTNHESESSLSQHWLINSDSNIAEQAQPHPQLYPQLYPQHHPQHQDKHSPSSSITLNRRPNYHPSRSLSEPTKYLDNNVKTTLISSTSSTSSPEYGHHENHERTHTLYRHLNNYHPTRSDMLKQTDLHSDSHSLTPEITNIPPTFSPPSRPPSSSLLLTKTMSTSKPHNQEPKQLPFLNYSNYNKKQQKQLTATSPERDLYNDNSHDYANSDVSPTQTRTHSYSVDNLFQQSFPQHSEYHRDDDSLLDAHYKAQLSRTYMYGSKSVLTTQSSIPCITKDTPQTTTNPSSTSPATGNTNYHFHVYYVKPIQPTTSSSLITQTIPSTTTSTTSSTEANKNNYDYEYDNNYGKEHDYPHEIADFESLYDGNLGGITYSQTTSPTPSSGLPSTSTTSNIHPYLTSIKDTPTPAPIINYKPVKASKFPAYSPLYESVQLNSNSEIQPVTDSEIKSRISHQNRNSYNSPTHKILYHDQRRNITRNRVTKSLNL